MLCVYSVCCCCEMCSFSVFPSFSQCEHLAALTRMFVNYTAMHRVIRFYDEAHSVNVVYPRCSRLCFLFPHILLLQLALCFQYEYSHHTQHNTTHASHTGILFHRLCAHSLTHAHFAAAQHDLFSFSHIASTIYVCVIRNVCLCLSCAIASQRPHHFCIDVISWCSVENESQTDTQVFFKLATLVSTFFYCFAVDLKGKQTFWNLFHSNTGVSIPSIPLVIWKQTQDTLIQ